MSDQTAVRQQIVGSRLFLGAILLILLGQIGALQRAWFSGRFSLALLRSWPAETVGLLQESCAGSGVENELAAMGDWLVGSAGDVSRISYRKGLLFCLQGNLPAAQDAWLVASDKEPAAALFWALTTFGTHDAVATPFSPGLGQFGYQQGIDARLNSDNAAAAQWLLFALAQDPTISAATQLAAVYQVQAGAEKVDALLRSLVRSLPAEEALYWWAGGQLAERDKAWAAAAEAYEKAAQLTKGIEAYSAFTQAGIMWYRAGAYAEAEAPLQKALALGLARGTVDFDGQKPLLWLGRAAFPQLRYEEALAHFDQLLAINPEDAATHFESALTLDALGRRPEAIAALTAALALHPNPPQRWQTQLDDWRRCSQPATTDPNCP